MTEADLAPQAVALAKHEAQRSPLWSEFRDRFIAEHPQCGACGKSGNEVGLQAHHIFPFHYCIALGRPELELDARNLITLCETEAGKPSEDHHLLVGHLEDFQSSNLDVVADALSYYNMSAAQIRCDPQWLNKRARRLPHLELMSDNDKAAFLWAMNMRYPVAGQPPQNPPPVRPSWLPADLL